MQERLRAKWSGWPARAALLLSLAMLLSLGAPSLGTVLLPYPLWGRLTAAGLLTLYAASRNDASLLPVAAWISLPNTDWVSLALLLAVPRLAGWRPFAPLQRHYLCPSPARQASP